MNQLLNDQIDALPFRAHSCAELMGKNGLGATGQKRATYTLTEMTTGRTKSIKSKYLEKGTYNEQVSIDLTNKVLKTNYVKNEVRVYNEYLTGECDLLESDHIANIKTSWDLFTFKESCIELDSGYEWQLRAYMELYNKPKARLIYCLTDTPYWLVDNQLKPYTNEFGMIDDELKAYQIIFNNIFTRKAFDDYMQMQTVLTRNEEIENSFIEIPEQDRVFTFDIERDKTKTALLYARIKTARDFLKQTFNK